MRKDIAAMNSATQLHVITVVITVAEIIANVREKETRKAAKSERLDLESEEVEEGRSRATRPTHAVPEHHWHR